MARRVPRIIGDIPTVENTDLLSNYVSSAPSTFALDDKRVLYFGSADWEVSFKVRVESDEVVLPIGFSSGNQLRSDQLNESFVTSADLSQAMIGVRCCLFVLNSNLVLWVPALEEGLEIPYTSIVLHALNNDKIYFQIESNKNHVIRNLDDSGNNSNGDDSFVEITATPVPGVHGNGTSYPLFQSFENLSKAEKLQSAYNSICECSSMFVDSESDDDENEHDNGIQQPYEVENEYEYNEVKVSNSGNADDLNEDMVHDHDHDQSVTSGMDIDMIGGAYAYATKRRQDEDDEEDEEDNERKYSSRRTKRFVN